MRGIVEEWVEIEVIEGRDDEECEGLRNEFWEEWGENGVMGELDELV